MTNGQPLLANRGNGTSTEFYGALLRGAVMEYEATTGEKLGGDLLEHADSLENVMKFAERSLDGFKDFRHDSSTWDKFRTILAKSLNPILTAASALNTATTNIWPPVQLFSLQ
jgi:hypothetical protein